MQRLDLSELAESGFWDLEHNSAGAFRWTRQHFQMRAPGTSFRFARLEFANNVAGNRLSVAANGMTQTIALAEGWQDQDVGVAGPLLEFSLEMPFRPDGDGRELGLMLRSVTFHDDEAAHRMLRGRHDNFMLNEQEFRSGAEFLTSTPPLLRVTLSKSCNIANEAACVYCAWDHAKGMETGSPDMTPEYFESLGRFGANATSIGDCSIGEPPMETAFARQLEVMTAGGRLFEFTSNGQTLSAKKRRAMLGKTVRVYVSIDSATAAGYARYRDLRFDMIIRNIRALLEERKEHGNRPEVIVSFLVMRSNRSEIAAYIDLMADVGVDAIKFRALAIEDSVYTMDERRGGHRFTYSEECLSPVELADAAQEIERHRHRFAGDIVVEWDVFTEMQIHDAGDGNPICSEPWKTAYVLSRGIMPCTYAPRPLATLQEIDPANVEAGLVEAYNNEEFRELRRELAAGRLPGYCLGAHSCPLTKAHFAAAAKAEAIAS